MRLELGAGALMGDFRFGGGSKLMVLQLFPSGRRSPCPRGSCRISGVRAESLVSVLARTRRVRTSVASGSDGHWAVGSDEAKSIQNPVLAISIFKCFSAATAAAVSIIVTENQESNK